MNNAETNTTASITFQHLALLISQYGINIDEDELASFMAVIEAPSNLTNLLSVCENLQHFSSCTEQACSSSQWRWTKASTSILHSIAEELLSSNNILASRLKIIQKQPLTSKSSNLRRLNRKFPLYTALFSTPKEGKPNQEHIKLKFYALISSMSFSRSQIENLPEEIKELKQKGLKAVRHLAELENYQQLTHLPKINLTPERYLREIKELPAKHIIHDFAAFLEKAIELNSSYHQKPSHDIEDLLTLELPSTNHGHDHIDFDGDQPLFLPSDPQQNEKDYYNSILFPPDMVPAGYDIFFPNVRTSSHNFNPVQAGKQIAKDNQLLHFSWPELNQYDISILLNAITFTENSTAKVSACAYLHFMLWAGLSAQKISTITTATNKPGKTISYCAASGTLNIITRGPKLTKDEQYYASDQTIPKQSHIKLSLPQIATTAINAAIRLNSKPTDENDAIFLKDHTEINSICCDFIHTIPKSYRLTTLRIQNYHLRQLTRMPQSDISTAALILGKDTYLSRTKVHYSSFDSAVMEETFNQSCSIILNNSGFPTECCQDYPLGQSLNVGTPFRPRKEIIRSTATKLTTAINNNRNHINTTKDLINFHNIFTAYTAFLIAYTTGYRRTHLPYIGDDAWDPKSGLAIIRDKDTSDYYHSRLIWLIKITRTQLCYYQEHLQSLYATIGEENISRVRKSLNKKPEFFFITHKQNLNIKLSFYHQILEDYGYSFPGHPQRHLLKSELQENNCSPEAIELFLGHWNHGQEAWYKTSSLHPYDFREELSRYLPHLAKQLNLNPIKGLTASTDPHLKIAIKPLSISKKTKAKLDITVTSTIGQIWHECIGTLRRGLPTEKAFRKEQMAVLAVLQEQLPELLNPNVNTEINNQQIDLVVKKLTPTRLLPETRYRRLTFLSNGLKIGQEQYGWDITIPHIPKVFPKGKNRARPSTMRNLLKCRSIEKKLYENLKYSLPDDPVLRVGQILLCAIIHGGLLHEKWVKAFPVALNRAIYQHQDWLWLDLYASEDIPKDEKELFIQQANPNIFRRLFADPLTQLLIYHWLEHFPEDRKLCAAIEPFKAIEKYFFHIKIPNRIRPKTLRNLTYLARGRSSITIPAFLSEYAENQLPSSSLPDQIFLRSLDGDIIPIPYGRRQDNSGSKKGHRIYLESQQKELFKELKSFFKSKNGVLPSRPLVKRKLQSFIKDDEKKLYPIIKFLAQWAFQLLNKQESEKESRQEDSLRVSSVKNYLGYIGEEVTYICRDLDPINFRESQYISFYMRVARELHQNIGTERIKNKDFGNYNKAISRLHQFHQFLFALHSQPPLNIKNLLVKGEITPSRVSTNLITVQQYKQILAKLGWGKRNITRHQRIAIISTILWYRTGARKEEIRGLLIEDFQNSDNPEILIYPNIRKLKSESAIRRLLLWLLIPKEELQYIIKWIDLRLSEPATSAKSSLFTTSSVSKALISVPDLSDKIKELLKTELYDQSAVPHHMRDSFIQNHIIKLMLRNDIQLITTPHFMDDEEFSQENRTKYFNQLFPGDKMGGKKLYAGAILLGHADIDEGFRSYFHLTDWLLGYNLRHATNLPDTSADGLHIGAIKRLTKLGRSQVYDISASKDPILKCIKLRYKKFKTELTHPMMEKAFRPTIKPNKPTNNQGLPEFDVTVSHFIASSPNNKLPKAVGEFELTRSFYLQIQVLSPAKQKRLRKTADLLKTSYLEREKYIQLTKVDEAIKIIDLLRTVGLRTEKLRTTFHPSRYIKTEKNEGQYEKWKGKISYLENADSCQIKGSKSCIRIHLDDIIDSCGNKIDTATAIILLCRLLQINQQI